MFGGGYLYLTAFRSIGTFTQLVSKVISGPRPVNPTKTYCLSMWTRINSADLEMRLHLVRFGDGWADSNRTKQIFTVGGVNQSHWTQVQVNLDQNVLMNTNEVQLIIEGRIVGNCKGAIAIDDISVKEGQCVASSGLFCEDGTPYTKDQICDFVKNCPSGLDELGCGNCDFENGKAGTC